jgi:hypothetical protein
VTALLPSLTGSCPALSMRRLRSNCREPDRIAQRWFGACASDKVGRRYAASSLRLEPARSDPVQESLRGRNRLEI